MKQLLDITSTGTYGVVALYDRAFCLGIAHEVLYELPHDASVHCITASTDRPEPIQQQSMKEDKEEENHEGDFNDSDRNDSNQEGEHHGTRDSQLSSRPRPRQTQLSQQIQAVAIHQDPQQESVLWCAISRFSKNLSIYRIQTDDGTVERTSSYLVPKRISALCFARVPAETSSASSSSLDVVVAGDLSGDAIAYALCDRKIPSTSLKPVIDKEDDEDEDHLDGIGTGIDRRLLLGHTASMLTGVKVAEAEVLHDSEQSQRVVDIKSWILTSDRDEKIRVSMFPESFIIHGYLLGHQAFVSCLDAKGNRCASVSGDDSLRLWDFVDLKQLAVATEISLNNDKNENDEYDEIRVPSRVAMDSFGDIVATICDDSKILKLWKVCPRASIGNSKDDHALELHCSVYFDCPAQPLAIGFAGYRKLVVLMTDPEYIQILTVTNKGVKDLTVTLDEDDDQITKKLRTLANNHSIPMPERLLEKDEHGNLKMQKMNERRSGATLQPWNNAERKQIAKERDERSRKRKLEQKQRLQHESAEDKNWGTA
jgi:tRNA (guanine-N(7)-)-methyltransferase subunit TRM82